MIILKIIMVIGIVALLVNIGLRQHIDDLSGKNRRMMMLSLVGVMALGTILRFIW